MVKKIGNWLFIFLCVQTGLVSTSYAVSGRISLHAKTINGDPLSNAVVGVPFLLEVQVLSSDSIPGTPHITGLQNMHIEDKGHVSTINSIVNGVRSTKKIFQYRVRVDTLGVYAIGPALLVNNKKRLQSNNLTLNVVQEEAIHKKTEPFLKMGVDKKQVVIGEPIQFYVRFYPLHEANLEGMSEAKFPNLSAGKLDGPFSGQEEIEGEHYQYIEWKTTLYAKKAGSLTIPAVSAVYKKQRPRRHPGFELFDQIFSGGFDKKQISSNAITLEVDELPPHDGPISGVGNFKLLSATIDHTQAKEGEGCVYTLILEGKGDFDSINPIELTVPEGLKYYESKSLSKPGKKMFEYIIQGIKPGTWTIPAQSFTYFDLASHTYQDLKSNPITLTIEKDTLTRELIQEDTKNIKNEPDKMVINIDGPWQEKKERSIPILLYIFLLSIPVIVGFYRFARLIQEKYQSKYTGYFGQKYAFKRAYSDIKKAEKEKNTQALYDIFIVLFATRGSIEPVNFSEEHVAYYLEKQGFSVDERNEWQQFFNELTLYKFFKNNGGQNLLFDKAKAWLVRLEKRL